MNSITPEAVATLLTPLDNGSLCNAQVQVLSVEEGVTQGGRKKVTLTISDGVRSLSCGVVPLLFKLFEENDITKNTIVAIKQAVVSDVGGCGTVIILDMALVCQHEKVIGDPTFNSKEKKHALSSGGAEHHPVNLICARDIKNVFLDLGSTTNEVVAEPFGVPCEYCNCHPCDWTAIGPDIISHLMEKYVGCFIDMDGNVTGVMTDSTSKVTNRHLRYLAYCAFSAAKHGYLGRKKRIPLPHCVENGVKEKYPDECEAYVGFQYAKEDK